MILTKCFCSRCFVSYLYSFVVYLYVNGGGLIASVWGELVCLLLFVCGCVVSVWGVSSSSGCLGWAALFCCGAPWAFHVVIFQNI